MYQLLTLTTPEWTDTVIHHIDDFLIDHASCEKKASGMAMSLVSHYPDRAPLLTAMIDLAIEELQHFRQVVKILQQRQLIPQADQKDEYINQLRKTFRKGSNEYLLDRLLIASIVEARGYERFTLLAKTIQEPQLKQFYQQISTSEKRHYLLFLELCEHYFPTEIIHSRLNELLQIEASIITRLPLRPALH